MQTNTCNYCNMNEYLIIESRNWLALIDSEEIWYIKSDGNYSIVYLTNGKEMRVRLNLGNVERMIERYIPNYQRIFRRIGKGLIINKKHLYGIDLSSQEVRLFNRKADGYMNGYAAGYSDGKSEKQSLFKNIRGLEVSLPASKEALEALKNEIEQNMQ